MDDLKENSDSANDRTDVVEGAVAGVPSDAVLEGAVAVPSLFAADPLAAVAAGEAFAVVPLEWCPHLEFPNALNPVPGGQIDVAKPCADCGDASENWLCLSCFSVHCGRFVQEHAVVHGAGSEHPLVLSFSDLSVWCYVCDSYVHHEVLLEAKTAAHFNKFGFKPPDS